MSGATLAVGFVPLVDAAPLIVAQEMGFASEEGIELDLQRAASWSQVRDMLVLGRVEAAHMLSPVPVAMALGLGGMATPLSAVSVLSVNGDVIGVSGAVAERMRAAGYRFDFADATAAGRALIAAARGRLRLGVPFPFSMHSELIYYWLSALGLPAPQEVDIRTVPPPLMARAIAADEIDAFCVGEPWGSIAVETGVGELLLPGNAIWAFAPEKVLAVRTDWAEDAPVLLGQLMRAVWRAGRWLGQPDSHTVASEILARSEYLDMPAEVIDRAMTGRLTISASGGERHVPGFVEFHRGAANFPWRSQAAWIARQLAARTGLDRDEAARLARQVFRTDLYRRMLRDTGAELPGASEKLEGAVETDIAVASVSGRLFLRRDRFFDGRIFDPSAPD
ncbi:nitrate transporter [Pseudooceanicola sp. 216_PA32_1]|uniref:Nitrate transporter n=1 Tax=Pseudooceanicola pacificus TaxID=2676438 RepID=A0A844W352_9RHOB|nr:ABC transporter substrate-binding protein [Pseudooceanicola pacificus]MWB78606.1 nitrate transporter [Pseudooceanicola pacificus]